MALLKKYCLVVVSILFALAIAESASNDGDHYDEDAATTMKLSASKLTKTRPYAIETKEIKETESFPGCGRRTPEISEGNRTNTDRAAQPSSRRTGLVRDIKRNNVGIVGGEDAKPHSWPWMVAIHITENPGEQKIFLCDGSLISQQYVLTAAHCCVALEGNKTERYPEKFSLMVGSNTTEDGTEYLVEKVLLNPKYNPIYSFHDVCLLKVNGSVELTKKAYPVCLSWGELTPEPDVVTITGWGTTSYYGNVSVDLQEVETHIVPLKQCNDSYGGGITDQFICAGEKKGGKDACQGDSGGPMVAKRNDSSWVQIGIVSFGIGCAEARFPGVYVRVSKNIEWIFEIAGLSRS